MKLKNGQNYKLLGYTDLVLGLFNQNNKLQTVPFYLCIHPQFSLANRWVSYIRMSNMPLSPFPE